MKSRFLILTITLMLIQTPNVFAAAPKVGGKCPSNNFEQTHKGVDFICKKIGKKLKWQKILLKPISLDNLDLKQVPLIAYENVIRELEKRKKVEYVPNYIVSPMTNKVRIEKEVEGISRAIVFFSPFFLPEKFQIVYLTSKDQSWIEQKSMELGLSSLLPPGETWESQLKKYKPCGFGTAGKANGIPTFIQCIEADYVGGYKQNGPHEYAHLFQQLDRELQNVWYIEGSASFFGWTLGFYPYDPKSRERSGWVQSLFWQAKLGSNEAGQDFESKDIARFKKQMEKLASIRNSQEVASIGYWVGGLATEVLIALYGMDKFFVFAEQMRVGQDVNSSMQQTFGISVDTFYEKLAPYAWAQMD